MMYLKKHPNGPELPAWAENRWFKSYVAMADWFDEQQMPPGLYWIRNPQGANLATAFRDLRYQMPNYGRFWVEGRGNI